MSHAVLNDGTPTPPPGNSPRPMNVKRRSHVCVTGRPEQGTHAGLDTDRRGDTFMQLHVSALWESPIIDDTKEPAICV